MYYNTRGPFLYIENELLCTVIHYAFTILTGEVISAWLKSDSHILQTCSCLQHDMYVMIS